MAELPMLPNKGVFVLGMHRSGTSAATRLVNLLGVPLSVADDVASRPSESNRSGHWESAALRHVNDSILRDLGGDVWAPPDLETGWIQSLESRISHRAVEIFRAVYLTPQWAWKDPRNCITLPFWRETVAPRSVVVVTYRNPLDVADSLTKRDRHHQALGVALWERYSLDLLRNITGLPGLVCSYEDLIQDPNAWCQELWTFLNAQNVSVPPLRKEVINGFVDDGLRSHRASADALETEPLASHAIRDLFNLFEDLRGPHEVIPALDLPEPTGWARALLAERRRYAAEQRRSEGFKKRLSRPPHTVEVAQLKRKLRRETKKREALQAKLDRILSSRSFRYARPLRLLADRLRGSGKSG